jgi:hypothetical protein
MCYQCSLIFHDVPSTEHQGNLRKLQTDFTVKDDPNSWLSLVWDYTSEPTRPDWTAYLFNAKHFSKVHHDGTNINNTPGTTMHHGKYSPQCRDICVYVPKAYPWNRLPVLNYSLQAAGEIQLIPLHVAPCGLVDHYHYFRGTYSFYSEDWSSRILQNNGRDLPEYMLLHPVRQ